MAKKSSEKFSVKNTGSFNLNVNRTSNAKFSEDGMILVANNGSKVFVWDTTTGEKITLFKSPKIKNNINSLTMSMDGNRVALSNDNNLIEVFDLKTGELIQLIKKKKIDAGRSVLTISCDGSILYDATFEGLVCWSVESGAKSATYKYNNSLFAKRPNAYRRMPTQISTAQNKWVLVCYFAYLTDRNIQERIHDELYLYDHTSQQTRIIETDLMESQVIIAPDGLSIFHKGYLRENDQTVFRLLDLDGKILNEKIMNDCRNARDFYWQPDGSKIAYVMDAIKGKGCIINANTFESLNNVYWPILSSIALSVNNNVALAGDKGAVVPYNLLDDAVLHLGIPALEKANKKLNAYQRRIELRKNNVPRVALFLFDDQIRIESEKLINIYTYQAQKHIATIPMNTSFKEVGTKILDAFKYFDENSFALDHTKVKEDQAQSMLDILEKIGDAEEPVATLGELFIKAHETIYQQLPLYNHGHHDRILGYRKTFSHPCVPENALYLSITYYEGTYDLWPSFTTKEHLFFEDNWPHIPVLVSQDLEEALGEAAIKAFKLCTHL